MNHRDKSKSTKGGLYELALFAGAGGGILGGMLCGTTCVGAVEFAEYPRKVLEQRQRDGILPEFPIWDDVTTFRIDNEECREYIEVLQSISDSLVISGGFPCQDISTAGRGSGIEGERSGLWSEFARIISEIRPARVEVENSPALTVRGLDRVLGDLAAMGYSARWGVLGAVDVGAPHKRERIWIVATLPDSDIVAGGLLRGKERKSKAFGICEKDNLANSEFQRLERQRDISRKTEVSKPGNDGCEVPDTDSKRLSGSGWAPVSECDPEKGKGKTNITLSNDWWEIEPELGRMADGVANRVDRLKAIGNGQVPAVAAAAWNLLTGESE